MRKIILLFLSAACVVSCVDNDYDLSKIDTDDVTIGDDTSVFRIPLAKVEVKMSELSSDADDISGIFDEADDWLPDPLPGGEESVDLDRLRNDPDYIDLMLSTLIDQMKGDQNKLDRVAERIWNKYANRFIGLLGLGGEVTREEFIMAFNASFATLDEVQDEARNLASEYLSDIRVDDLRYRIDKIDISDDVLDMLVKNLDKEGTPNPCNTLHLYGSIFSELPVGMQLTPAFEGTGVRFTVQVVPDTEVPIAETPIYENDLRSIIAGLYLTVPLDLQEYFPGSSFDEAQRIVLDLHLVKHGGLTLEI